MPKKLGNSIGVNAETSSDAVLGRYIACVRDPLTYAIPSYGGFRFIDNTGNTTSPPAGRYPQSIAKNTYQHQFDPDIWLTYNETLKRWSIINYATWPNVETLFVHNMTGIDVNVGSIFNNFTTNVPSLTVTTVRNFNTNTPGSYFTQGFSVNTLNTSDFAIKDNIFYLSKYFANLNNIRNVTIGNITEGIIVKSFNIDYFNNLYSASVQLTDMANININNKTLRTLSITNLTGNSVSLNTPNIESLTISSTNSLTSIKLNTSTPFITSVSFNSNIGPVEGTAFVTAAAGTNLSGGTLSMPGTRNINWYENNVGNNIRKMFSSNWNIDIPVTIVRPVTSYFPTRPTLNKLILLSPGTHTTTGRFLSGEYNKTGQIINNFDVFANNNNSFVWFNTANTCWNVTNPGINGSVYLSAVATNFEQVNNPPTYGWYGPAYNGWSVLGGTNYFAETQFVPTDMLLLSGYQYVGSGANPTYRYNPQSTGGRTLSSNLAYGKYNYTGLGWSTQTSYGPRIQLITPIHFIYPTHMTLWAGNNYIFYQNNGTTTTRTILSSVTNIGGSDIAVGILSSPLPLSGVRPFRTLGPTTYNVIKGYKTNLFYINQRSQIFNTSTTSNVASSTTVINLGYPSEINQICVPIDLSNGAGIASTDDSSSPYLLPYSEDELLLLGYTQNTGGPSSGPSIFTPSRVTTINARLTALEAQFGFTFGYRLSTV